MLKVMAATVSVWVVRVVVVYICQPDIVILIVTLPIIVAMALAVALLQSALVFMEAAQIAARTVHRYVHLMATPADLKLLLAPAFLLLVVVAVVRAEEYVILVIAADILINNKTAPFGGCSLFCYERHQGHYPRSFNSGGKFSLVLGASAGLFSGFNLSRLGNVSGEGFGVVKVNFLNIFFTEITIHIFA